MAPEVGEDFRVGQGVRVGGSLWLGAEQDLAHWHL